MADCLAVVRGYAAVRVGDRVLPSSYSDIGIVSTFVDLGGFKTVTPADYQWIHNNSRGDDHWWVQLDPDSVKGDLVEVLYA